MFDKIYKNKIEKAVKDVTNKIKGAFGRPITLQIDRDTEAKLISFSTVKSAISSNDLNTLLSIYQKILNCDLNMSGSLENRRDALLSLPFTFEAETKEEKIIKKVLENFPFDEFIRAIANDTYYGISLQNIVYEVKDSLVLPKSYNAIFPTLLHEEVKDKETNLYFKTGSDKKLYVKSIDKNRLIIHRHNVDNSILQNNSIAYKLLWSAILKHTIITLNLEFFDKAAIPPLIIKVDDLSDEKKANSLFRQMMELKSTSVGMFTHGIEIDTLKFNSKADFEKSILYIDKIMDKFILGGTLSSTNDSVGSQALGKVHDERLMEKVRSDAKLLSKTITIFFNQILALNLATFTPVKFGFILPEEKSHDEMKVKSETVSNLSSSGYVVPLEEMERIFNIKGIKFKAEPPKEDNHIELNAAQNKDNTQALEVELLAYVVSILHECNSYEDIEFKILEEFNYMEFNQLQEILIKNGISSSIDGTVEAGNDKE